MKITIELPSKPNNVSHRHFHARWQTVALLFGVLTFPTRSIPAAEGPTNTWNTRPTPTNLIKKTEDSLGADTNRLATSLLFWMPKGSNDYTPTSSLHANNETVSTVPATSLTGPSTAVAPEEASPATLEFTVSYAGQESHTWNWSDGSRDRITLNAAGTVRVKPYQVSTTDGQSFGNGSVPQIEMLLETGQSHRLKCCWKRVSPTD